MEEEKPSSYQRRDSFPDEALSDNMDVVISQDTAVGHYGPLGNGLEETEVGNMQPEQDNLAGNSVSRIENGGCMKDVSEQQSLQEAGGSSHAGGNSEGQDYPGEENLLAAGREQQPNNNSADRSYGSEGNNTHVAESALDSANVKFDTGSSDSEIITGEESNSGNSSRRPQFREEDANDSSDAGRNHDNESEERGLGLSNQRVQKRVGWRLASDTELNSSPAEDELKAIPGDHSGGKEVMADHSTVDTAEQVGTGPEPWARGESGLKEREGTANRRHNNTITVRGEMCTLNRDLNALENKRLTETENENSLGGIVSENGLPASLRPVPHRLIGRRPLSASGALTRTRKLLEEEDSELSRGDASRPFSAIPAVRGGRRRYSLTSDIGRPDSGRSDISRADIGGPVSRENWQRLSALARKHNGSAPQAAFIETPAPQTPQPGVVNEKEAGDSAQKPPRPSTAKASRVRPQSSSGSSQTSRRRSSARSQSRPTTAMGQPRTWDMQFTKDELKRALPRRNFFSCHTQTLKEAGYEVEDSNPGRRRRLFFFHHPEDEEAAPAGQTAPIIKEPPGAGGERADDSEGNVQDKLSDNLVDTAVGLMSFMDRAKRRRSSVMPQQPQVVECKPLSQYLTYVRDNPAEYRQMIAKAHTPGCASQSASDPSAASNPATIHLIQMGRAFQARNAGGERADDVIRAAYALRPRSADPNRFAKIAREKSPLVPGLMSKRESNVSGLGGGLGGVAGQRGSKPGSEDHRHRQEPEKPVPTEHMTEMEKRRQKAEEWTKTVTTDQLVRAKLHVLKELGHEEHELSKWWLAFRDCKYIRPKLRWS